MRRVNTAKRFSGQKGGALVDAAIAIPVLVLLFAGITDVLSMLDTKAKVQAAASELQSLRLEVPMEIVKGHVRPDSEAAEVMGNAIVEAASAALDGVSELRRSYDPTSVVASQAVVENFAVESLPVVVPIDVDEDSPTFLFSEAPSIGNIEFRNIDIAAAVPVDDSHFIQSGFDLQMEVLVASEDLMAGTTMPSIRIGRSNLNISLNDSGSSSDKDAYSEYYSSALKAMPAEVAYFYRLGLAHEDLTVGSLINLDERPAVVEGVLFASLQPRFAPYSEVANEDSYQFGKGFELPGIDYDRPVVVPNWEDRGTGGGGEPTPPGSSGGGSKPGADVYYNATGDYGQGGGVCTAVEPAISEQTSGVEYDYNSDFWGTGSDGTAYISGACGAGGGAGTTDTGVNADVEVPAPPNPYSGCTSKACGGLDSTTHGVTTGGDTNQG